MPERHYCTYFDHRYLPRGTVLIDSIRRFAPDSVFHVLALDDRCAEILAERDDPGVEIVTLAELEAFDPELLAVKATRRTIEYYFTITPCLPRCILARHPDIDAITYLDSDLWFLADPELVFAEIGDASIAITPHRFSPERAALTRFGRFNVGWLTWRNDETGRRCLEDYRADCLDWCSDIPEPTRFADQKYLDKWPDLYPNLVSLEHPGINAASWNVNNHQLSDVGGMLFLGDRRLIFWHYHGLKERPGDTWEPNLSPDVLARHPMLVERVYQPYIRRLELADRTLALRYGLEREVAVHLRYGPDPSRPADAQSGLAPETNGWRAFGPEWPETPPSGWNEGSIAEIRRGQWRMLEALPDFDLLGSNANEQANILIAIDAVDAVAPEIGAAPMRVLDWGGEIGMMHRRLTRLRPAAAFDWTVKELGFLCDLGRELNPAVRFVDDADAALGESYDLVVAAGALEYEKDWRAVFARLAASARHGFLLTRQPTVDRSPSFVAQQGAYGSVFTCWVLNQGDIFDAAAEAGMMLLRRGLSGDAARIAGSAEQPAFRSFLFVPIP